MREIIEYETECDYLRVLAPFKVIGNYTIFLTAVVDLFGVVVGVGWFVAVSRLLAPGQG